MRADTASGRLLLSFSFLLRSPARTLRPTILERFCIAVHFNRQACFLVLGIYEKNVRWERGRVEYSVQTPCKLRDFEAFYHR